MGQSSIFNQLYNGSRVLIHDSAIMLQQSDLSDANDTFEMISRMKEFVLFYESSFLIEDKYVYPLFNNTEIQIPANFQEDRALNNRSFSRLKELISKWEFSLSVNDTNGVTKEFIRRYFSFMTFNLEFIEVKMNLLNQVLKLNYKSDALFAIRNDVLSFIPYEKKHLFYKWVLRGMNNAQVISWLEEARESASEETFHSLLSAAEQSISGHQWQRILGFIVEGEMVAE